MLKTAFVHGSIAGLIVISTLVVGFFLGADHGDHNIFLGYTIMIVALTLIFLAIKGYRDGQGGVIKFGSAFLLGLMTALVAGAFYVLGWEGYMAATNYTFMDGYVAAAIEAKKAAGVTGAALETEIAKLEEMKVQYANPLFRMPMTFMEIFPVGLVIALISAAILRNPKAFPARRISG